ncbi:MAG TPA: hypothetical protein VLA89_05270 [Gemmatimonadales bacterium]|nr:hypothetical protein [Gemmatimonadales bacterium]
MADSKISALAAVTDLLTTDELVLARAGATKKIAGDDLAAAIAAALGFSQIDDQVLGAAGTFDFTSIPQTYRHLRIEYQARGSDAAAAVAIGMRFNNDSGNTYYSQLVSFANTVVASSESLGTNFGRCGVVAAAGAGSANLAGAGTIEIPNYASGSWYQNFKAHNVYGISGGSGDTVEYVTGGWWENVAAITQITLIPSAGSTFAIGSRATLFGLGL